MICYKKIISLKIKFYKYKMTKSTQYYLFGWVYTLFGLLRYTYNQVKGNKKEKEQNNEYEFRSIRF